MRTVTRHLVCGPLVGLVLAISCGVSLSAASSWRTAVDVSARFCNAPVRVQEDPLPFKARLAISGTAVKPGGVLSIRLENLGGGKLSYVLAYELARQAHGSWIKLPTGPLFAPLLGLPAGTASPCQIVEISRDADAGWYRVTKKLGRVGSSRTAPLVVRATFRVQGAVVKAAGASSVLAADSASSCHSSPCRAWYRNLGGEEVEVRPWHFDRLLGTRTIDATVGFIACTRKSKPAIQPRIVERSRRAVVTMVLHLRPVPPGTRCLRLRGRRHIYIQFNSAVNRLKLFDGYFVPPKLRWPQKRG